MRIFIMFGTQDKRFDRLLEAIQKSTFIKEHEVYVQLGYTKGEYSMFHGQEYFTEEELQEQIELADVIITHAGVGSIVSALKLKKRVIVVPRLGKYKEQNNDHQVQIMEKFDQLGYIIPVSEVLDLDAAIDTAMQFEPKEYKQEKQGILDTIEEFIDSL